MSILVIDVGTSGMKGILYGTGGNIIGRTQVRYYPCFAEDGIIVEQALGIFASALLEILKWQGSKAEGQGIDAITITSQRSSCICVGRDGNPLGNAICWQDRRTAGIIKELGKNGEEIAEKSGAWPNPVFLGAKLTWIRRNAPEVYENVWKFMTIADYLLFLLTGQAVTDDTYASRTNLMNLRQRRWDPELLEIFEVEEEKLCEIIPVGSRVGNLNEKMAKAAGLPENIPVYTAGGDQQCALIGQGVFDKGRISVTLGTGQFVGTNIDKLPENLDGGLIYNASSVLGTYVAEYGSVTCGAALDWVLNEIYGGLGAEAVEDELLKTRPGAGGVVALPYFQGRITPDYNMDAKAAFAGISLGTKREDILRAVVEGIGAETATGVGLMPCKNGKIHLNGGMSKSHEICSIIADMLGQDVYASENADATAFGAFLVTAKSMGIFETVAEGYEVVFGNTEPAKICKRNENLEVYRKLREKNQELYLKIKETD